MIGARCKAVLLLSTSTSLSHTPPPLLSFSCRLVTQSFVKIEVHANLAVKCTEGAKDSVFTNGQWSQLRPLSAHFLKIFKFSIACFFSHTEKEVRERKGEDDRCCLHVAHLTNCTLPD